MKHKHHKIKFKDGKRIRTDEIVTLTLEEHAKEHKRLYKLGGHWKDKVAYEGLSGQIPSKDVIMKVYSENGKKNVHMLHTPEMKAKAAEATRKANTGRKLSPEHLAATRTWGMKQSQHQKDTVREALSKNWIIITPTNNQFQVRNLHKFCKENNLDQGNLHKVSTGILKQHKGYRCIKTGRFK